MAWRSTGYPPLILGGADGKKLLVKHITGYSPHDATEADIRSWATEFAFGGEVNLGIRCPPGVIGIDVDAYDGKRGLVTIAELEARLGPLPPTWTTTARHDGSGIRWYRVPVGWRGHDPKAQNGSDGHVELIQRHHRYAVVPPSTHHTGPDYHLTGPGGNEIVSGVLPSPGELPELPAAWLAELASTARVVAGRINAADVEAWLDEPTGDDYSHGLAQVTTGLHNRLAEGVNRHKAMFSALCWAFKEATAGGYSRRQAHDELKAQWDEMIRNPDDGEHDEAEFDAMLPAAIERAEADDHDERWLRMCRDYGTDHRSDKGKLDGIMLRATIESKAETNGELTEASWLGNADAGENPNQNGSEDEDRVLIELGRMKVRAEAKRRFDGQTHQPLVRNVKDLTKFLAEPSNPTPMRIERVMPDGGRVVFSAPYKAGKTTAIGNLIRSLVDGDPFLDVFAVNKKAERLVLIDNELSEDMVRDWLLDQNIRNTDAVVDVVCLRGEVASFDLLNEKRRAEWSAHLRDLGCDYVIFDCLRPVLDALGLEESHDAGKFLTAFDALLSEAETSGDSAVVHHMGHANERSRGDSRIQDWPDAIWKIVREDPDDEFSPRYFSANGRDVDVMQGQLKYDPVTRHLSYQGLTRADAKKQRKLDAPLKAAIDILTDDQKKGGNGIGKTQLIGKIRNTTGVGEPTIKNALDFGEKNGFVSTRPGPNNATVYELGSVVWTP
jgi:hypothetical protein